MPETTGAASLGGARWALVELEGVPVELEEGAREPYLELDSEESRLSGSGGVNRLVASFELEDGALRIGPVGTTMMAGPEPAMRREAAFLAALERVTAYELEGRSLRLLADERVVARFAAVARPLE